MPYGMYLSAAGADVQSRRMELISNNLANVDTVGFKQQLAIAQARHSEAILRGESSPGGGSIDDLGGGVFLAESLIDFGPGAVKHTGVDTDFAIEGDGFFMVEKDGQQFLTRAGNFTMRADGKLPTQQGHSVLDIGGNPIGIGSRVSSVQTDFGQGAFRQTNNPLNIVIEGRGFLQVQDASTNTTVYTRAGNLSINAQGQLVIGSAATGRILQPPIQIDTSTMTNISINDSGQVLVQQAGQAQPTNAGTLQLATFVNPEGLLKMGENLYSETTASGIATLNNLGTNGTGSIRSGMLEASNVEPVQELIDLITTQRSFELNSQAIKAGDEVLQLISNLRRG